MSKPGRPPKPKRIKLNAVYIENGKSKHLFSVITYAPITEVLKTMQSLQAKN